MSHRFVPDYPLAAKLGTGSTITPPELSALFGRVPSKADLRRFREKLETLEPDLMGRIVLQDGMLTVIGEIEGIERGSRFSGGLTKAAASCTKRTGSIVTHRLPPEERKRADVKQMALQRHAIALGAALKQLVDPQLPEAEGKEIIRK